MAKTTYKSIYLDLWFQRSKIPSWQEAWQQVAGMVAGAESRGLASSTESTAQSMRECMGSEVRPQTLKTHTQ